MSKKRTYEVLHDGEACPKCGKAMQRREHKTIREKQKRAPYYFREWDYCVTCHHVQHYDWAKVHNKKGSAAFRAYQELDEMNQSFLRLID